MIKDANDATHWNGSTAIAACIGSLPLMMALTPFSFSLDLASWQKFMLFYSLIVPFIQLAIVLIVIREGGSVFRGWFAFPYLVRLVVTIWLPLMIYTAFQTGNEYLSSVIGVFHIFSTIMLLLALSDRLRYQGPDFQVKIWFSLMIGIIAYYGVLLIYIYVNYSKNFPWVGPYPGFINIRHVAFLGFISYCSGLYIYLNKDIKNTYFYIEYLSILSAILGLVLIFWTGSRGPNLAVLLFTAIFFYSFPEKRKEIRLFSFLIVFFALILASALPLPADSMLGVRAAFGFSDINSGSVDEASSGRIQMWLTTIKLITEKPVLGWGVGQYLNFNSISNTLLAHPHNSILQFAFASGILGLLTSIVVYTTTIMLKFDFSKLVCQRFHLSLLFTLTIYSFYDGILFYSFPILMFVLVFIGCLRKPAPDMSD